MKIKNKRTKKIVQNIGLSMIGKAITTLCSFFIVPMTISYINPTRYGIWLTLSSIIAWISIFDLGFGQGFRNKFAEAISLDNKKLAKEYLSTTYFSICSVMAIVYLGLIIFNQIANWSSILNIESNYNKELHTVFFIISTFFCLRMVLGIFGTMLTADQKPGISSIISALGSILSIISIYLLTVFTRGSLTNLALYYSGIPCIVILIISFIAYNFHPRYKQLKPQFSSIRFDLIKNIISLGIQFFIINISMLFIFQMSNIIISRNLGPLEVTNYNIAHKYFNILYILSNIILNPFWSAYTEAYTLGDFGWMKKMLSKLEFGWLQMIIIGGLMTIFAPFFYKIWVGDNVTISFKLNFCMYIYYMCLILGGIYMYIINGIGKIRIQLILYLLFSFIAWPILGWSCRRFGTSGILLMPAFVYALQAIIAKIQLTKIMNRNARGLWIK